MCIRIIEISRLTNARQVIAIPCEGAVKMASVCDCISNNPQSRREGEGQTRGIAALQEWKAKMELRWKRLDQRAAVMVSCGILLNGLVALI